MSYDPTGEDAARERGLSRAQLQAMQEAFGLTNDRIEAMGDAALARLLRKLELPDRARERGAFEHLFELGDEGRAAPEGKLRALEQLVAMRRAEPAAGRVAGVPVGGAVTAASLSPPPPAAGLGPSGAGWSSLGPGRVGGRTRALVLDPGDPDRMWAGSVAGGVWLTTNGGANWHPVDDRMANLAVSCLVSDPTDARVLYAGTGEGFFNADAVRGAGIFRTVNGTAWSPLAATATPQFHFVNRLAVSADGAALLAATREGIFRSTDADRRTWDRVVAGNVADVRFHPADPSRAVAGGLRDGRVWSSGDGGRSWQEAVRPQPAAGRVEVTWGAADPDLVVASVDLGRGRLWRSTDGGATYQARGSLNANGFPAQYLGQQGWYDNAVWAGDPTDGDLVVVGGIDLWRSTDGGDTLRPMSDWRNGASPHADHHAIVSHPAYDGGANRVVFFGNDGGIDRASDVATAGSDPARTAGWTDLTNGYAVTQFYGAATDPASGIIVGGAQDNGTLAFHPAAGVDAWATILGGDGGACAADPRAPAVFYGEYVFLDLYRNTDGATSDDRFWENHVSGHFFDQVQGRWDWKPLPFTIPDARDQRALFIAPFVLDPNAPDRLLAGGMDLWRTEDARTPNTTASGPSWASIKPGVGSEISAIAVAAGDSDLIWVGHLNGELYRSRDGTAPAPLWELMNPAGPADVPAAGRLCTRVIVDPADPDRVYTTFGGYNPGNVWRSDDGGSTWSDLSAGLPEAPARCLAIHPRRPDFLYLGTEVGLFTSEDFGTTWSPTNEGPANCPVSDLVWAGEVLVCATHGRGMFSIDLGGVP